MSAHTLFSTWTGQWGSPEQIFITSRPVYLVAVTDGTGIVLLTFKLFAADPAIGEEIMIKHVVMWKLKETAMGATKYENALAMKKRLEGLQEKIPELQSAEVGINIKVSPTASDVVLISTFSSEEALETYMNHPEHKRVADFVSSVRLERSVVDYIVK